MNRETPAVEFSLEMVTAELGLGSHSTYKEMYFAILELKAERTKPSEILEYVRRLEQQIEELRERIDSSRSNHD